MITKDFSINPPEAMLLWNKSKRQVMWAIYRDHIRARQGLNNDAWFISFQSCVSLWGYPTATNLLDEIEAGYHG